MTRILIALSWALLLGACSIPEDYLREPAPPPRPAVVQPIAPSGQEVVTVRRGEDISAVARRVGVGRVALIEANGLQPPYRVREGQRLLVPRPGRPAVAARPAEPRVIEPRAVEPRPEPRAPEPRVSEPREPRRPAEPPRLDPPRVDPPRVDPPREAPRPEARTEPEPDPATPARAGRFRWPVRGDVISEFGPRPSGLQNDGINIAAPRGTPIAAAENGVVIYSGNELRGFGNLLLVRHADGFVTAYAHCDEILVRRGDQVRRGQTIARVGSTGNVSQPQLHFEVRRDSRPVDPRPHLGPVGAN